MAKSPKTPSADVEKKGNAKRIAAIRDKFKKAMDDPDFRQRMARHLRELMNQGRDD